MKISIQEALHLWRETLRAVVRHEDPDLTTRQMLVMLVVYAPWAQKVRVRDLAEDLSLSKPAISRALDRLEQLGYVRRKADSSDGRSVVLQPTMRGSKFLADFAEFVQQAIDRLAQEGVPSAKEDL